MTSSQPVGSLWTCEGCKKKEEDENLILIPYEFAQLHMELTGHIMRRVLEVSVE